MKFNLKITEVEIIQLALAEYIVKHKGIVKNNKDFVERAEILLDNINFYKRQQNEE